MTDMQVKYSQYLLDQQKQAETERANRMKEAITEHTAHAQYGGNYVPINNLSSWNQNYAQGMNPQGNEGWEVIRDIGQGLGQLFGGSSAANLIGAIAKLLA